MSRLSVVDAPVQGRDGAALGPPSRPRIFALLPRGEAIRNFVYSHALEDLAERAEVTVLSVSPPEILAERIQGRHVVVQPLNHSRERWVVGALRDLLDVAHGRYLWSRAAQQRWRIRDHEARTPALMAKRWATKALCYPFANASGVELLSRIERAASRWLRTTDEFLHLFRQTQPALVFNSSHVHGRSAIQAVHAAQCLGIPTAAFIFSWDNLTSQGRIIPAYDFYLVWNEAIREQLLKIYPRVRPEQIYVTGTPQFDFHFRPEFYWSRDEYCRRVGADPRRPIILYSTGMANHMPGEDRIVERIADMVQGMTEFGPPQLLVRVYPKDRTGRFDRLKSRSDILFPAVPWHAATQTPEFEDLYLLTNTLRHCAAGINIASTISLELCMFDKPTLNVAYDPPGLEAAPPSVQRNHEYYEFDHYAPVVKSGAIEVACSEGELRGMLAEALRNPGRLAERRRALVRAMFGERLDGRCAQGVAATLLKLASPVTVEARQQY